MGCISMILSRINDDGDFQSTAAGYGIVAEVDIFLLSENIQLYMHRRLGGREPNFDTNVVFGLLRLFFLCIIRQILNINFMQLHGNNIHYKEMMHIYTSDVILYEILE